MIRFTIEKETPRLSNEKNFHYFSKDDMKYSYFSNHTWITMYVENKAVGVIKLGVSIHDEIRGNNSISLWYIDICNDEQSKGYSKIFLEYLFQWLSENKLTFTTSYYSDMGKERIYKYMNLYAKKYKIRFFDRDGKYDYEYIEKNYSLETCQ